RKCTAAMAFELSADQRHDFRRIAEAIGSRVQRNKSLTRGNKVQQSLFLGGADGIVVGIQNKSIVPLQVWTCQILGVYRIGNVHPFWEILLRQDSSQQLRIVVLAVMAQKKQFQPTRP